MDSAFLKILYDLDLTGENVNILGQMITPCTAKVWGGTFLKLKRFSQVFLIMEWHQKYILTKKEQSHQLT